MFSNAHDRESGIVSWGISIGITAAIMAGGEYLWAKWKGGGEDPPGRADLVFVDKGQLENDSTDWASELKIPTFEKQECLVVRNNRDITVVVGRDDGR